MRPRVSFSDKSGLTEKKFISKRYQNSNTHSPGLSTVQCTCSHPKILGLSVMDDAEGVSTAFSVL